MGCRGGIGTGRRVVAGASLELPAPVPSSNTDRRWQARSRVECLRLPVRSNTHISMCGQLRHSIVSVRILSMHTASCLRQMRRCSLRAPSPCDLQTLREARLAEAQAAAMAVGTEAAAEWDVASSQAPLSCCMRRSHRQRRTAGGRFGRASAACACQRARGHLSKMERCRAYKRQATITVPFKLVCSSAAATYSFLDPSVELPLSSKGTCAGGGREATFSAASCTTPE